MTRSTSAALDDLREATGFSVEIAFVPAPDDPDAWRVIATFADGTAAGFEVLIGPPDELLAAVADGLQQAFIEQLRTPIPRCPGHSHPMQPAPDGTWRCPSTGERRCAIGECGGTEPG